MLEHMFSMEINDYGFHWNAEFLNRMNNRARRIFAFEPALMKGAHVLDIGARHGFWSWAAHRLGAATTVGIEGRQDSADKGARLMSGLDHRFLIGNAFDVMPQLAAEGARFDVILNLGFYYHIYDHYGMLGLMDAFAPKVIVIDSEFDDLDEPVVRIRKEKTWEPNNAIAEKAGQRFSAVGNASLGAMRLLAECYEYQLDWIDWSGLSPEDGCEDYRARRRFTCILHK